MPTSLAFRLLDAQVVAGRADEPALIDPAGTLTFAQLLHESAVIAGGIEQLATADDGIVTLELVGRDRVLGVLALVRLGLRPGDSRARLTVTDEGSALVTVDDIHGWALLRELGRVEPARALQDDPDGYDEIIAAAFPDVVGPLLRGEPIRL